MLNGIGKQMIAAGAVIMVLGVLVLLAGKVPYIGKLPGDIVVEKENFTFYFPLTTCIITSLVLSALLFLFLRR